MSQKLFLFDLDGVLINSLDNMKIAWRSSCLLFAIKVDFNKFYQNLGMGFYDSLNKLKIYENQEYFIKNYQKVSKKNFNKIKIYKNTKYTLDTLKRNHKVGIVTSKDLSRTRKILKLHDIKVDIISASDKKIRSKPNPDQILLCLKKLNFDPKNTVFVGDTKYDYKAAKSAKVNFIYASYGYGEIKISRRKTISDIKQIIKISI